MGIFEGVDCAIVTVAEAFVQLAVPRYHQLLCCFSAEITRSTITNLEFARALVVAAALDVLRDEIVHHITI